MPDLTLMQTAELLRAAIERIEKAEKRWKSAQTGPSYDQRVARHFLLRGAEIDFADQWRNVQRLLASSERMRGALEWIRDSRPMPSDVVALAAKALADEGLAEDGAGETKLGEGRQLGGEADRKK